MAVMSLLRMSIQAGLLIAGTALIRAVALHKLPNGMFLALWAVALGRLLVPVSIPSRLSIYPILDAIAGRKPNGISTAVVGIDLPVGGGAGLGPAVVSQQAHIHVASGNLVTAVWLLGVVAFFLFFGAGYLKNFRQLKFAHPIQGHEALENWLEEHRTLRSIAVLRSDRVSTPISFGVRTPYIVLPGSMDLEDELLLKHVLTHEYVHIRRLDGLWKLLMVAALCLHWFNPMVWLMLRLAERDLEITCDERVLRQFEGDGRAAYAQSLIKTAQRQRRVTFLYQGFSKHAAEERIVAIMKYKKYSMGAVLLSTLIVVGTTAAFAASAPRSAVPSTTYVAEGQGLSQEAQRWLEYYLTLTAEEQAKISYYPIELKGYFAVQPPFSEYERFGISYDADGTIFYHGQRVRYFFDGYRIEEGVTSTRYDHWDEEGTVDVYTVRDVIQNGDGSIDPFGELTGIEAYSQEEFDRREPSPAGQGAAVTAVYDASGHGEIHGETLADKFQAYEIFGVELRESSGGMGNVFYLDQPVRRLIDERPDGGILTYESVDGGEIVLSTVYSEEGELIGVAVRTHPILE